ncbi:acid phosphatase [Sporormia fimetaria CBS 119925]|uniref:Phytase A n=1 Tax=Sporormia fimetaria CBS 119925 TaxID=1340428 RepID=A0A6A6VFS7_9PLEO|nr:acid phosphatase [Sporormia fimetaria CBS 119925]
MSQFWDRVRPDRAAQYNRLPVDEAHPAPSPKDTKSRFSTLWKCSLLLLTLAGLLLPFLTHTTPPCDTIDHGYRCSPKTTHFWGQYSLWYSVPSDIQTQPPPGCSVTFASVLSRHGGRDPTYGKSIELSDLIWKIQDTAEAYPGSFSFLEEYEYQLGKEHLTDAGRQEMVNSGAHFFRRYSDLVTQYPPFVRSGDQERVAESARKWLRGLAEAGKTPTAPVDLYIPESSDWNNTLSHRACPAFDDDMTEIGYDAQEAWSEIFVPPIQSRVNLALGTNITVEDVLRLMDMCPFDTVASPTAKISKFCHLFSEDEWHQYDYWRSLEKYYSHGNGNPLAPSLGAGYVNELIARLTESPVQDSTNTNRTLDSDPATFPVDRRVYADFSHDNTMAHIMSAMGLYNATAPLSWTELQDTNMTKGFSAAWTVPFAARMYVEKLSCDGEEEEFVRVLVNDRVIPMDFCQADHFGRCKLSQFVESQSFARTGGHYDECFD